MIVVALCALQCSCWADPVPHQDPSRAVAGGLRPGSDPRVSVRFYVSGPLNARRLKDNYTGAKFEPVYGCYLGAYAEADETLDSVCDAYGRLPSREEAFGVLVGKHLATAFTYCSYGRPFPLAWARRLTANGIMPQVALEPNQGLDKVQDNAYLHHFARDAAKVGGPVFLRYASEMNGNWCAYSGNPRLYRRKWRLVHHVMAEEAPNAAMVWCVFTTPESNWGSYYPGDAYVDWVGINIYDVLHHDNNPNRPAWRESPVRLLRHFYRRYAARKPIAICEFGATHCEALDESVDYSSFAASKTRELLTAIPRLFPRVKLIDFFDCDNLIHAPPGRKLNDYSVTDSPQTLNTFRRCVASSFYLSRVVGRDSPLPLTAEALGPGARLSRPTRVSLTVDSDDPEPVVCSVDGREILAVSGPGVRSFNLDPSRFAPGRHCLSAAVQEPDGSVDVCQQKTVFFADARPHVPSISPYLGEVEVDGAIASMTGADRMILRVNRVTLPGGQIRSVNPARLKTVRINASTVIRRAGGTPDRGPLQSAAVGRHAAAVGADTGPGRDLTAREIDLR